VSNPLGEGGLSIAEFFQSDGYETTRTF
jgi:hypothetical protein